MKRSLYALFAATVLAVAAAPQAHAMFHFTLTEAGGDVDILGVGSIDTTDLTAAGVFKIGSFIDPGIATTTVAVYTGANNGMHYSGVTGPDNFGSSNFASADVSAGDTVGLETPSGYVDVPVGYVSGTPLADSAVYAGQTFASLGLTPGTYTYTWGTGADADSLVVQIGLVPEPSTWGMVGLSLLGLLGWMRVRTRRA